MEDGGWKAKAIKYATGWERGADGKWRYEIPDGFFIPEKIKINKPLKLPEVYDSPELYRAYPQLKDVNVVFKKLPFNLGGSYDPKTNTITRNSTLPLRYWHGGLIHEIQHVIQYLEEFTTGTNERVAGSHEAYKRTAGEVEARNAAKRKDMSEEERRNTLLVDTEDIRRNDQSIRLNGKIYTYDEFQESIRQNPMSFYQTQISEAQAQAKDVREQYENTDKWLKAPNGKQSNLDGWQWTEVRTPNFKRYFGDWESIANAYPEITAQTYKEVRNILKGLAGKELKSVAENVTATISKDGRGKIISGAAVRKSEDNGFSEAEHFLAAANIEKLFANSIKSNERADDNTELKAIEHFSSLLMLKDKPALVTFTVKVTNEHGRKVYSLELMNLSRVEGILPDKVQKLHRASSTLDELNISRIADNFNNTSKVVDENGEPLVVWHGTDRGGGFGVSCKPLWCLVCVAYERCRYLFR